MKTLVFQSCQPTSVPAWIQRCMESVEAWSGARGYAYRRLDDTFFAMVPDWFYAKSARSRLPITDLARLQWISKFLKEEWERVIWFDADVLVFNPDALRIECTAPEILCRDVWVRKKEDGSVVTTHNVNNAVMSFTRESSFLEFYIQSCLHLAKKSPDGLSKNSLGPKLLKRVQRGTGIEVIRDIANLTPRIMREIAENKPKHILIHAQNWQGSMHAANLCSSLNKNHEDIMDRAVELLLATKGAVANPDFAVPDMTASAALTAAACFLLAL